MFNMKSKLQEALNIEGAEFIGNGLGYDVFQITTWGGAQSFVIEDTSDLAGVAYAQSENTFNTHINPDNLRMYFFVIEDTNKVYGAMISQNGELKISGASEVVTVNCNYAFENAGHQNNVIYYNHRLPLDLIPNLHIDGCDENGILIQNNTLMAVLPEMCSTPVVDNLDMRNIMTDRINSSAFTFGLPINNLIIGENWAQFHLTSDSSEMFNNVSHILVALSEKPRNWEDGWNEGKEDVTSFGYGLDPQTLVNNALTEINRILPSEEEVTADPAILKRIRTCKDIVAGLIGETAEQFPQEIRELINDRENQYYQRVIDNTVAEINSILPNENEITIDELIKDRIGRCRSLISASPQRIRDNLPQEIKDRVDRAEQLYKQAVEEEERNKIKYKVVGNEIIITSISPSAREVDIPAEIEGKPVTKIAPYAAYDRDQLRVISLPNTLKEIGQGAFADCNYLDMRVDIPKNCIVGKNATLGSYLELRKR